MSPVNPKDPFDPFAEPDGQRTFVMPSPGGRTPVSPPGVSAAAGIDVAGDLQAADVGLNPLVAVANPLLAVVPQIRVTMQLADPGALKESLAQGLRQFDARAAQLGLAPERVVAARYVLCTLLDEAAAGTPWGGNGAWGRYSLLMMFHNEAAGGERVFQLMAKLAEQPAANRDLLELIYAALCLGFQGRYRFIDGGSAQLEAVRDRLAQIIAKERGDYAAPLAQHWRGASIQSRPFLSWLPLWVTAALAALLLVGVYVALSFSLAGLSDPAFAQIESLRLRAPATVPPAVAAPRSATPARLAQLLQPEIAAHQVTVEDQADRSVITVRGDGLFEPGSASLNDHREALMQRVADALKQVPGQVLVTGHTDNQPIRSLRFPSNWQLSEERAKSVRSILVLGGVPAERVTAEGRADGESIAPNDTPDHRSLNRRVEIELIAPKRGATS